MKRRVAVTAVVSAAFVLGLAACGGSSGGDSGDNSGGSAASTGSTSARSPATSADASMAHLVGSGCEDYAMAVPSGTGSVEGMAHDPVATAASNNPLLTTLTAAISGGLDPKVNLVTTLDNGQFTVFAPVDTAFAKLPASTVAELKVDGPLLRRILTYHVIRGQLSPTQVVGRHPTLEGGTIDVTGSGDSLKVEKANVICGGVHTANATLYLIDTVLKPTAVRQAKSGVPGE